jgi:hypothetical protein
MHKTLVTGALLATLLLAVMVLSGCGGAYVGSNLSTKYHDPSCVWAEEIDGQRRVYFGDAEEAEDAGYAPCSECLGDESSGSLGSD